MSERALSSRTAGTTSAAVPSLCEKYAPQTVAELTVPPKKLEALSAWLCDDGLPRTLLLEGPTGCAKSSVVRVLATERGYEVHEWTPPTPTLWSEHTHLASSFTEVEYSSKVDEFVAFIARATKYAPLSFLMKSTEQQTKKKTVLLIRDIPSSDEAGRVRVLQSLRALACASQTPCCVILTEQQNDSGARGGDIVNREVRAVMENAGAICVNLNSVTSAAMTKAVVRVCEAEGFDISQFDIQALVNAAHGDVRSAMQTLEFWCYGKQISHESVAQKAKVKRKREPKQAPTAEATARAHVSSRDQALGLFHALGKFLYNKRSDDVSEHVPGQSSSPLCENLNDALKRPPMTYNPEEVLSRAAIGSETATAFLFENYPDFMSASSLDTLALGVRYMSDAMSMARSSASIYHGSTRIRARDDLSGGDDSSVDPTMLGELCAGSVAARGVLFSSLFGSSKRTSGFLALRGPAAMKIDRALAANRQELRAVVAAAHAGDFAMEGTTECAALETLPALRLLSSASAEGAARVPYLPTKWWRVGEDAATFEARCAQVPVRDVAPRPITLAAGVAHEIDRGSIGVYAAPPTLDDIDDAEDEIEDVEEEIEDDIELDDWEV